MNLALKELIANNLQKDLLIEAGQCQKYSIVMENKYLKPNGEIYKTQVLDSVFYRNVDFITPDGVGFTTIGWEKVQFKNNKNASWMKWTFPNTVTFPHALFNVKSNEKRNSLFPEGDMYSRVEGHCDTLTKSFDHLPKLPSTYLLIMQAFDIIAFETFPSLIHSNTGIMKNPGKYVKIGDISEKKNQIGVGLYSDNSYFHNGDFYFKFIGYGTHHDRCCSVFEYKCDGSTVNVEEHSSDNNKRKGKSYYMGSITLDLETGLPVSATMFESYMTEQLSEINGKKARVPNHIRRDVYMELIQ